MGDPMLGKLIDSIIQGIMTDCYGNELLVRQVCRALMGQESNIHHCLLCDKIEICNDDETQGECTFSNLLLAHGICYANLNINEKKHYDGAILELKRLNPKLRKF